MSPRPALIGLLATFAIFAASALAAPLASAAKFETFLNLECPRTVAVNQSVTCTASVNHIANADEHIPTGLFSFSENGTGGQFNPENCLLVRRDAFSASCSVEFGATTSGVREFKARYSGDTFNNEGQASTSIKVFVPGATRFAAPNGQGLDPCTSKANPCSLFRAASSQAPGSTIVPGAEVELSSGTYSGSDLGPSANLTLETGIILHGEFGQPASGIVFASGGLFASGGTIRHLHVDTGGPTAINMHNGILDEVVAHATAANGVTCGMSSGLMRDVACVSSGSGSVAIGAQEFTERGESLEQKLRNVTAVSTGSESVGLLYSVENAGPVRSTFNVDGRSVIAKGVRVDVVAKGTAIGNHPFASVIVRLDHSNYTNAEGVGGSSEVPFDPSNFNGDPALAPDNIHETFASPTINRGVLDGSSGGTDIDGEARTQDEVPDVGGDEITPRNETETKLSCEPTTNIRVGDVAHCTATVIDHANKIQAKPMAGDIVSFKDLDQPGAFTPATCVLSVIDSTHAGCSTKVEFKPTTVTTHTLEASFPGDNSHIGSIGTLFVPVKALQNHTETKLSCEATTLTAGDVTTCNATVSDEADHGMAKSLAGGTVSFADENESGDFIPSGCTLVATNGTQATCQTRVVLRPNLVGNHTLEASFQGDDNHVASAGTLGILVKAPLNNTETKLTCKSTTLSVGDTTLCTVIVTDKADGGRASILEGDTVIFKDNTESGAFTPPASCTLKEAGATQATCRTQVEFHPTTIAAHTLEASFQGDPRHVVSTGTLGVTVKAQANHTETQLSCRATSLNSGETTHCTATVIDDADHGMAQPLAGSIVNFVDKTQPGTISPPSCTLVKAFGTLATCQTEVEFHPTTIALHSLEASFPGDDNHSGSSSPLSVAVNGQPSDTETKLNCKATTLNAGDTTLCTATVTDKANHGTASPLAGGTVTFKDNTEPSAFTQPASCTLKEEGATQAICQTEVEFHPTTIATHSLEASFQGDNSHVGSTGTLSVLVKAQANHTETKMSCKATTLNGGDTTHCTATVTDKADKATASALAGDTVTFKDNTEPGAFTQPASCTLKEEGATQATCQTEVEFHPTAIATHSLEASFPGDGNHVGSATALFVSVKAQANDTESKLNCKATTLNAGESTHCTVTVTDKANHGTASLFTGDTVTFKDNTEPGAFTQPASCTLKEEGATQATCQTEAEFHPTAIATHSLEASFAGDDNHVGSSGTLGVSVKSRASHTETKLSCKAATVNTGESVHCTATVTDKGDGDTAPPLAGGSVTFKDLTEFGAITPASCTLVQSGATQVICQTEVDFTPTVIAPHSLEATFAGDDSHVGSSDSLSVPVHGQPNDTETKLSCRATTLNTGESTRCTATVTDKGDNGPASPLAGGSVSFQDATQPGTISPASCTLVSAGSGPATCQTEVDFNPTTVATHTLEAHFPTDNSHVGSTGTLNVSVKVLANHTETKLSCKATTLNSGESTHCTATVTDKGDHDLASAPIGQVNFVDNTQPDAVSPASCTLVSAGSGPATCQAEVELSPTTIATHRLEASFPGDSSHVGSTGTLSVPVKLQADHTETKLSCKATALNSGDATHCSATVTDKADHAASSLAGDTVSFADNTESAAFTAPATCTLVAAGAGPASCQTEVEFKPTTNGAHVLEANFGGDDNHVGSRGTLGVSVNAAPPPPAHSTNTTLVCAPATLVLGAGASQCTATVEDAAGAGASHPGGEVKLEILSGEGVLAAKACNLPNNGQAKVSCQAIAYTPSKAGAPELKATYVGDAAHTQSSGTARLTVNPASTPPPPPTPPGAPNTILQKKPRGKGAPALALFGFNSDQAGSTFKCKLDKKPAKACTSPFKVKVKPGRHTFTVQAFNAQGLADPTPVVFHWTVGKVKKRARH
jgi:hypothetical protein